MQEMQESQMTMPYNDPNSVYVGLRVYTHKEVPAVVVGCLKPAGDEVKDTNEQPTIDYDQAT